MRALHEDRRSGLRALETATTLLQRVRRAHPTKGLYEAADLQWRWRIPRSTDVVPQLFWFGDDGHPEAAVVLTAWRDNVTLDPLVLPDADADLVAHVVGRGLAHAGECGFVTVELEVDEADEVLRDVLIGHGFELKEAGLVETWLSAGERPAISSRHADYRLCTREQRMPRPHHLTSRGGPDVERRLRQTSLYRPDLDLVAVDGHDVDAAYGLFWFDPESATGLVEPMRTEDEHQRRGLARHILTTGVDLLAKAGAERIKIVFEPDNPASSHLYLDVGFRPVKQTVVMSGPTARGR